MRVEGTPGDTEVALKLHVGELGTAGETAQARSTALLNPFMALTVTEEVAELPGLMPGGLKADSATLKS